MRLRILALIAVSTLASAETPGAPDGPVIRVDVNLVQVDAVVTDAKGHPVRNLTADDFEIRQDGKARSITNFAYVQTAGGSRKEISRDPKAAGRSDHSQTSAEAELTPRLKPGDVKRTVALVVDDLGLSFENIARIREALKKFVNLDMQPGDLVAVLRTGAGLGALQQFTADKRLLYAAIDRVKYNATGRVGISSFAPLIAAPRGGSREERILLKQSTDAEARAGAERNRMFTVGTLGAVSYVVDGLRELPGRKSMILFSENLTLSGSDGKNQPVMDSEVFDKLRHLADAANRSAVVVYTIDPRGVQFLGVTAADEASNMGPRELGAVEGQRSDAMIHSQEGLVMLADQTGGLFLHNMNDLTEALQSAMEDSAGYYLIGYHPDPGTFSASEQGPKFHKVAVRVKRAGFHVRSRKGFFGISNAEREPPEHTRNSQITRAMRSPFGATGIHVRLTPLFANDPIRGSYLDTMLSIDGKDLKFIDEPGGWHKAVFDLVVMTFGDNGQATDTTNRTYTIRAEGNTYEMLLKNGLVYSVEHPAKKPGAYQMRVVVRDVNAEQLGSASQFIEVPDLTKGRLTLSSILLSQNFAGAFMRRNQEGPSGVEGQVADPLGSAAVRRFTPGTTINYAYKIFNAHPDSKHPSELNAQARLFRDGYQVYVGPVLPMQAAGEMDRNRLEARETLQLGTDAAKGDYVLQVMVIDNSRKKKRSAGQAMDFEVR
jgi:VWFA-related protein